MADGKVTATLGVSAAKSATVHATINVDVKVTRRYIWMFKLKYIWAIIRAKVGE